MKFGSFISLSAALMTMLTASHAEEKGIERFSIVKHAIADPAFAAALSSDAIAAADTAKGSDMHHDFVQKYFSGDERNVQALGKGYRQFCMEGPGEGCSVARNLLRGSHYECIDGPGEGCGHDGEPASQKRHTK
jgi:hypothetical protein